MWHVTSFKIQSYINKGDVIQAHIVNVFRRETVSLVWIPRTNLKLLVLVRQTSGKMSF